MDVFGSFRVTTLRALLSVCLLLPVTATADSAAATPVTESPLQVLASIKPLQLLATSLLGELADVDVLVPVTGSPHHYSLKPSDMRRMNQADLMLWVGDDLELFLQKPIARLDHAALALLDPAEAVHAEHGEEAQSPAIQHDDGHAEAEHHHAGDPHLWMAPEQAQMAAQKIVRLLSQRYPQRQDALTAALQRFSQRLDETDRQIAAQLAPLQGQGFFVFHDAYASFTAHYGLKQLGYFTVDPARKPGARRLTTIRQALEARQARCVFVEPQFTAAVVHSIVDDLPVKVGTLDPMGSMIRVDNNGYFSFLQGLADQLSQCLAAG